jgi:hypothetical protein
MNLKLQSFLVKRAADLEDILDNTGKTISPVADAVGMDNLSNTQKGIALAALLAAPAVTAATSNRGAANGALQGAITSGGALVGYNGGKMLAEQLDKTNLEDYLGSGAMNVLKAMAMGGGAVAGGYAGNKAGERLWLG